MKKVFISHADVDRPFVERLRFRLEEMIGPSIVVVASDPVAIGESMFDAIAKTIRDCDAMLYVSSKAATDSQHVQAELAWGLAHGQTNRTFEIIPILRDEPHTVPHLLRSFRYLDLRREENFDAGVKSLAARLVSGPDPLRSGSDAERGRAETTFIELREALLQEKQELLEAMDMDRQRGLRKMLLVAVLGSIPTASIVVYALTSLERATGLLLIANVGLLFLVSLVAVAGYNSGAKIFFRRRFAAIDGLLGKGPLATEREDAP